MNRLSHGVLTLEDTEAVSTEPENQNTVACPEPSYFDYLFSTLQDPDKRLPQNRETVQTLIKLGDSMSDPEPPGLSAADPAFDSKLPSVYSYFGQFITHEIVFEVTTKDRNFKPEIVPLDRGQIRQLQNARTTLLDLDSVYGPMLDPGGKCYPVPLTGEEMEVGSAADKHTRGTDLPREKTPPYTALIGDRRNDANLITSQMHLAFLCAHNKLVRSGHSFPSAQRVLRQHFQWLIVSDYLPRVVDSEVLKSALDGEIDALKPLEGKPFMPVEFSAAAFRFGHSMLRNRYRYNQSHTKVRLTELFLPRTDGYYPVPDEWIIDWSGFIDGVQNVARRIDTRLVQPLKRLIDSKGQPLKNLIDATGQPVRPSLAALDLLRGYLMGLPTGQAVATSLGEPVLTENEIEGVAANPEQKEILSESGLSTSTPLWYYILAEAAFQKEGLCLGRVGSTIVAGVLIGLVRNSRDSILRESNWTPDPRLGNEKFDLAQLFKFAEVLP
jgi:hypothetical protein